MSRSSLKVGLSFTTIAFTWTMSLFRICPSWLSDRAFTQVVEYVPKILSEQTISMGV